MTLDRNQVISALPNYEIGGELGRGGWGVVLAARHRQLGREVAIKELPRAFAADPNVRARFVTEARLLASLDHPHIVPVYDFVEQDGLCLLVMENLPGGTLWSRFTTEGFTQAAACAVVLASCAGLQAAHLRGILHRDVKPENLMFSSGGALKVTDFGIAKVVGGDETLATRAGEVLGTPAYIAPEQARGHPLSPATDVYAIATMLYELLSGSLPFADDGDAMALLFKHAFEPPIPLNDVVPAIAPAIAEVVMHGLATDPADRFVSAEGFALTLAEACTANWGPGWLAAEPVPVMGAGAIVAATERVTAGSVPRTPPTSAAPPTTGHGAAPPTDVHTPAPPTDVHTPAPPTDVHTPAPPTVAREPADQEPSPAAQPTVPVSAPSSTVVRPMETTHQHGAALDDINAEDLVPVQEVVDPPAGPVGPFAVAVAALLVAVILALVGLGTPMRGGDLPTGAVRVAGVDAAAGSVVRLDLSKPIPISVGAGAPRSDRARLSLAVLGQRVSDATAPLAPATGGAAASVDDTGARYLIAGRLTGEIELLSAGHVVGHRRFSARTAQSGLASAPAAAILALILFAGAYAESFLRSLRRGRRKAVGTAGLAVTVALLGVAIAGVIWLVAGREPTATTVVADALLGALAGVAAAIGGMRIGRRRRFRRVQRRERAA